MKIHQDFHGTRDFYCIIGQISKNLIKAQSSEVNDIVEFAIERNFGGLPNSIEDMKSIFNQYIETHGKINNSKYEVLKCIESNIKNEGNRYLMLITKSSLSETLLISLLSDLKLEHNFIIGSDFENDNSEEYTFKILNKIQLCMEQGRLIILKNLSMIYPSLYNLFNQNFALF